MKSKVMAGSALFIALMGLFFVSAQTAEAGKKPTDTPPGFKLAFDLSHAELGELPPGLVPAMTLNKGETGSCRWQKVFDPLPPVEGMSPNRGRRVLEVTEPAGVGYNLLFADGTNLQDINMIVRIKDYGGKKHQGGGMIWRAKDEDNYYLTRWDPLEKDVRIYHVVDGKRTLIGSTGEKIETQERKWHGFTVKHVGDKITVTFLSPGKPVLEVTDSTISGPGMVGLWTNGDAVTRFRDLEVETAGRSTRDIKGGAVKAFNVPQVFSLILSVEDVEIGTLPEGFVSATTLNKDQCKWETIVDVYPASYRGPGKPPKERNVINVTEPAGSGFNVLMAERTNFQDLRYTVTLEANSGKIDQGGGPIWRAKDENNYYVARWNPLEENVRVYHVIGGKRTQIGTVEDIKANPNAKHDWRLLGIEHVGDQIKLFLDGKEILQVTDSTLTESGMLGLWTKADAATKFRDLKVENAGL